MRFPSLLAMMILAAFGTIGTSDSAFAESGVLMPRGPTFSMNDPIFRGLLLSPGFSKCKELRGRTYEWKCTYGDVPADPNGRLGKKPKQPGAAKSAKR